MGIEVAATVGPSTPCSHLEHSSSGLSVFPNQDFFHSAKFPKGSWLFFGIRLRHLLKPVKGWHVHDDSDATLVVRRGTLSSIVLKPEVLHWGILLGPQVLYCSCLVALFTILVVDARCPAQTRFLRESSFDMVGINWSTTTLPDLTPIIWKASSRDLPLDGGWDHEISSGQSRLRPEQPLQAGWLSVSVQSDRVSLSEPSTTEKGCFYPARRVQSDSTIDEILTGKLLCVP